MNKLIQIILLIVLIIVIGVGVGVYYIQSNRQITLQEEEEKIKKETYITSLLDVYNRDMAACTSGIQKSEIENKEEAINTNCIEPINDSRIAKLLKQWGYESELVTSESSE